jgi:DNA primase
MIKTKFTPKEREDIVRLAHLTLTTEDTDDTNEARDYLIETRGLNDEAIEAFKFGYIPMRTGHDWRGRVIMPLFDQHGELVVMTSRDFRTNEKSRRPHLHEQFNKKRYLFGLELAKKRIMEKNSVIIVEGQFDTVKLHVHGLTNTVGVLGSAFTFDHVCALRRYCQNFYLLFDNDKSGKENLKRAVRLYDEERLGAAGFDTEFYPVFFDKNIKDPDDLVKERGIAPLKAALLDARENQYSNLAKVRLWD